MIEQTLCEHIVQRNRWLAGQLEAKDTQIDDLQARLADARKHVHLLQTEVARYRNARDLWRVRAMRKVRG